jgi:hypothetical protein
MLFSSAILTLGATAHLVSAINFPYEEIQLVDAEVGNNSDIAFGKLPVQETPRCKSYPGYEGWPSTTHWSAFNVTLGGALLRGIPPAAACYEGEFKSAGQCLIARRRSSDALFV